MRNLLCLAAVPLLACLLSPDARAGESRYVAAARDLALQHCLDLNYTKFGAYASGALKDASVWTHYAYAPEEPVVGMPYAVDLMDYVTKVTGHYYEFDVPLSPDAGPGPHNAIFGQCMRFYKSTALRRFIRTLKYSCAYRIRAGRPAVDCDRENVR